MFEDLFRRLDAWHLPTWRQALQPLLAQTLSPHQHGDMPRWLHALQQLPEMQPQHVSLTQATIHIGAQNQLTPQQWDALPAQLMTFHPWRKGPFNVFGHVIDTEWRSDWKWARLEPHLSCAGQKILDVGCGNGYYCLRMIGAGAQLALGIDPTMVFVMQHLALKKYLPDIPAYVLPLGIDDLPKELDTFDCIFSMGVFYHRRSPLDHLLNLRQRLKSGGRLVLETLVIEGGANEVFVPPGRYAQMRNVWFLPSTDTLTAWLARCGFADIQLLDVTQTTVEEQRSTDWMHFQSLKDFLDPADTQKTIEGHPAPTRAIFIATVL